ncbi:MAG: peptidylprolyl isomerase, partial [Planctomycetota bacterium]
RSTARRATEPRRALECPGPAQAGRARPSPAPLLILWLAVLIPPVAAAAPGHGARAPGAGGAPPVRAQEGAGQEGAPAPRGVPRNPIPDVVARINDVELTRAQFERELHFLVPRTYYHARIPPGEARELHEKALRNLVVKELKHQEALRLGLEVTVEEIQAEVKRALAVVDEAERRRYQGREKELFERFRAVVERRILIARAEERAVPSRILVEAPEIRREHSENPGDYLHPEAVYLHHIFVKVPPSASKEEYEERRRFAGSLHLTLAAGVPFAEVAAAGSDDIYSKAKGQVGWVTAAEIRFPAVAEAAFELKTGDTSGVLSSLHGFHIIRVTDRRQARPKSLEEAREQIAERIRARRRAAMEKKWLEDLRSNARIELFYQPQDPGARSES